MRVLFFIFVTLNCALLQAQFTYFDQRTGNAGNGESEVSPNVDLANDGFDVWKLGSR